MVVVGKRKSQWKFWLNRHHTTLKNTRNMKSVSRAKVPDFKIILKF